MNDSGLQKADDGYVDSKYSIDFPNPTICPTLYLIELGELECYITTQLSAGTVICTKPMLSSEN